MTWDGGGGDFQWRNPLNWDTNAVPGQYDDVEIDRPGDITVKVELPFNNTGTVPVQQGWVRFSGGVTSDPMLVTADLAGSELTLSFASDQNGTAEVTIRATDLAGTLVEDPFVVTVTPLNDRPEAHAQVVTATEDGQVAITLSASDVETGENNLMFTIASLPTRGILTDSLGNEISVGQTFIGPPMLISENDAACDGAGTASFEFTVTDRGDPDTAGAVGLTSAPATVTVNVIPGVAAGVVATDGGIVRIVGSAGHDILMAGDVGCHFNSEALRRISAAWAATRTPDQDVVDEILDEAVIDADGDMLTGSSGTDWFIVGNNDKITDLEPQKSDGDTMTVV